jgi:hypothetical protein
MIFQNLIDVDVKISSAYMYVNFLNVNILALSTQNNFGISFPCALKAALLKDVKI